MPQYLVFARENFERALECVGDLEAPDEATARERARWKWAEKATGQGGPVEMVLAPLDAAHWVVGSEAKAESGA